MNQKIFLKKALYHTSYGICTYNLQDIETRNFGFSTHISNQTSQCKKKKRFKKKRKNFTIFIPFTNKT